jgi:2-dehydropantoate 2-reductase
VSQSELVMDYCLVGAGAIGATVGARLARAGNRVLFCDADETHVDAIRVNGVAIEGPIESFTVYPTVVMPHELPPVLTKVLLAVKAHQTKAAMQQIAPRLAPDAYVVSLQNGVNEPLIAASAGPQRTIGALVDFGAEVVAPGRVLFADAGTFLVGELDGAHTARVRALVADLPDARQTDDIYAFLWAKVAYVAVMAGISVAGLSIADALSDLRYRPLFSALAGEAIRASPVPCRAFGDFDPSDLSAAFDLMAARGRVGQPYSGIYLDLALRRRSSEVRAILGGVDGTLVSRLVALVSEIESGARKCEPANLELLCATATEGSRA